MVVAVLCTFCLTAVLFSVVPVNSDGKYDPWMDTNHDGRINVLDLIKVAGVLGTAGNPGLNVTITGWPEASKQVVFHGNSASATSQFYNASGFGQIHMTWVVGAMSVPEYVTFDMTTTIEDPDGGTFYVNYLNHMKITSTNSSGAATFPVPSDKFRFSLDIPGGTTVGVFLAFYLTFA